MSQWSWAFWVASVLLAILGSALLYRALFSDRSRGRRRCPKCWYDMTGVPGLTCPECGKTAKSEYATQRTRRLYKQAMTSVLVLLIAFGVGVTPRVAAKGPIGAIPLAMIIIASRIYDTQDHRLLQYVVNRYITSSNHDVFDRWAVGRFGASLIIRKPVQQYTIPGGVGGMTDSLELGEALAKLSFSDSALEPLEDYIATTPFDEQQAAAIRVVLSSPIQQTLSRSTRDRFRTIAKDPAQDHRYRSFVLLYWSVLGLSKEEAIALASELLRRPQLSGVDILPPSQIRHSAIEIFEEFEYVPSTEVPALVAIAVQDDTLFSKCLTLLRRVPGIDPIQQMIDHDNRSFECTILMLQEIGAMGHAGRHYEPWLRSLLTSYTADEPNGWTVWALNRLGPLEASTLQSLRNKIRTAVKARTSAAAAQACISGGGDVKSTLLVLCERLEMETQEARDNALFQIKEPQDRWPECLR